MITIFKTINSQTNKIKNRISIRLLIVRKNLLDILKEENIKKENITCYGIANNGMKKNDMNPFKEILKKNNLFK